MNALGLSTAELRDGYNLTAQMEELEDLSEFFGVEGLTDEIDTYLDDFASNEVEWADNTVDDWYDSAPWRTGNLREAIDYDSSSFPQIDVGIDQELLLRRAGQKLKAKRDAYDGASYKIPYAPDYPEWIDENVKKAGQQWKAVSAGEEPNEEREDNVGGFTPYIKEIWFALAERNKKEIFG